ncbi:four helix bundle protein [Paenibacillus sp. JTLBN-2024]
MEEKEVLGDQIWRAATSIAGNISEANAQVYVSVSFRQLNSALGSGGEVCTWLEILYRCKYIAQDTFDSLFEKVMEIRRMLIGMMKKLLVEMEDEIEVA